MPNHVAGRPRTLLTAALAVLLAAGTVALAPPASPAPAPVAPGDFASSFEAADPQPLASTVETDAHGQPIQGNLSGSNSSSALPGTLLGKVIAVTASADNPPNEVVANLKDGNPSTKWLAFNPTGWATYQLSQPETVVKYSLTSADDSPGRNPKDFTLQGSTDGTAWTDLDTRTGQTFAAPLTTNVYSFTNTTPYAHYRLNVTATAATACSSSVTGTSPTARTPCPRPRDGQRRGAGPVSGYNMKPTAGFTGLASLRYAGGAQGVGRSFATNKLYDVHIPVGSQTRLSYKVFPEAVGADSTYRRRSSRSTCTSPTAPTSASGTPSTSTATR